MEDFSTRRKAQLPPDHEFPGEHTPTGIGTDYDLLLKYIKQYAGDGYARELAADMEAYRKQLLPDGGFAFDEAYEAALQTAADEQLAKRLAGELAQHRAVCRAIQLSHQALYARYFDK